MARETRPAPRSRPPSPPARVAERSSTSGKRRLRSTTGRPQVPVRLMAGVAGTAAAGGCRVRPRRRQPPDEARGKERLIQRGDHRPEDVPLGGQRPDSDLEGREHAPLVGRVSGRRAPRVPGAQGRSPDGRGRARRSPGARPAAMSVSAAARIRVRPEPSGWGRRALVRRIRFDSPAARRIPAAGCPRTFPGRRQRVGRGMAEGPER